MDTLLRELIRQQHLKYETFSAEYDKAAGQVAPEAVAPSKAQFHRWLAGQLTGGAPYPDACRVLEHMFPPWTAAQLFEPYDPDRHLLPPNGDAATGGVLDAVPPSFAADAVCWALFKLPSDWLHGFALGATACTGASGVIYVFDGVRQLSASPASSPATKQ